METGRGTAAPLDSPPAAYTQKAKKEKREWFPHSLFLSIYGIMCTPSILKLALSLGRR
jgi:hypothetical protein